MNAIESTDRAELPPTFGALSLTDEVRRALDEVGYINPTPVQLATYDLAISGRDIIVQARTGTGKTAAFAIPLVDKMLRNEPFVQALVLAPTRELALQSAKEIARIGRYRNLHAAAVYGGAPMGRQIDELAAGAQIVSGTPGRVLDHLRRGTLDASRLRVLVLDEMDEMLSMGFARELNAILELIPEPGRRQTMCFSATVDGEVRRHAERHMRDPQMVSLSSDAVGAEAISHHVYMVSGRDRTGDLVKILEVEDPESAIVFCNLRSETEQVAGALKQAGFNADWLNGDLPQRDREKVMSRTREGRLRYLVATDVAARGIDISHLTHVVNYSFPESPAGYVHRTGRTGRAGRTGCAVSLVSPTELGRLYYLRLEYKISPIERALPSKGELQTRKETDRVALLSEAFAGNPRPGDLTLARRLLTHPDAERIVGGLLQTFFGTRGEGVDEEAAAARRARTPKGVLETVAEADSGAVASPSAAPGEFPRGDRSRVGEGHPSSRSPGRPERRGGRDHHDSRDTREPRDARDSRERRDSRGPREPRASDGPREIREPREAHQQSGREPREAHQQSGREPREAHQQSGREPREAHEQQAHGRPEPRGQRDAREPGEVREPRDNRAPRDRRSTPDSRGHGDPRETRAPGDGDAPREPRERSPRNAPAQPAEAAPSLSNGAAAGVESPEANEAAAPTPGRERSPQARAAREGRAPRDAAKGRRRERAAAPRTDEPDGAPRAASDDGDTPPDSSTSPAGARERPARAPADAARRQRSTPGREPSASPSVEVASDETAGTQEARKPREARSREPREPREGGEGEPRPPRARPQRSRRPLEGAVLASELAPAGVASADAEATPVEHDEAEAERAASGALDPELSTLLYLDAGRRDGVRIGEVVRLLRDVGELKRAEVGRIRIRDRHTFVEVPDAKLDELVTRLRGEALGEKALSPERAKVNS